MLGWFFFADEAMRQRDNIVYLDPQPEEEQPDGTMSFPGGPQPGNQASLGFFCGSSGRKRSCYILLPPLHPPF